MLVEDTGNASNFKENRAQSLSVIGIHRPKGRPGFPGLQLPKALRFFLSPGSSHVTSALRGLSVAIGATRATPTIQVRRKRGDGRDGSFLEPWSLDLSMNHLM